MKTFCVVATMLAAFQATTLTDVVESSSAGNLQALAGKWKPVEHCHHLLDPELVSKDRAGFEICIDKKLGDSHSKAAASDRYYADYSAFLKKNGHEPVASGSITFDSGDEGEHVISQKDGSLYLWYGIVQVGNPRIFIGRGSDKNSAETLVVEWASWCNGSPVDLDRNFATVIYERIDQSATRPRNAERPANKAVNRSTHSRGN